MRILQDQKICERSLALLKSSVVVILCSVRKGTGINISSPQGSHSSPERMVFWGINDQAVIFNCQREDVERYLNLHILVRLEAVIRIV